MRADAEEALSQARSYTAEHGHLAGVSATTLHHGYPPGRWLAGQRSQQQRRVLSPERQQALAAVDPLWCPPWNMKWQRSYHRARDAATSRPLCPDIGFRDLGDSPTERWLRRQCSMFDELHDGQQRLLSDVGITAEMARTAREHARTVPESSGWCPDPGNEWQHGRFGACTGGCAA
ncbi:helicase associated domain-containing protein [Streptomyces sp. NPDC001568]|uniref:helicase associated domain-containing protein n=1 Tax=Streptomyces sp. NPDC001568 TaxID=3364588 RepID=UPI0036C9FA3C